MDFGVVLQTDPPATRVIDLAKRAETYGFTHAWTFDSHLLWEEPFVIYSRILNETHRLVVGPMVTNPATRDWTVTASLFATLNEMYGNRTVCGIGRGDSAVRVINGKPVKLAEMREAIGVIRGLANGEAVDYKGTTLRLPWSPDSRLEVWVAAYGPRALALTGEVGDGFILQLADPQITAWSIAAVGRAGGGPGPRRHHDLRRCAGLRHRRHARGPGPRPRPVPLVRRHGRQPRRRHRQPLRHRRRRRPGRADRLHQGPRVL
jgi:probable F420-dependent oxidoreductase